MARDIILHRLEDWSQIDEKDSFWGKISLLHPDENFGIHRYNGQLWTSGQVGIGRVFDISGSAICDREKEHILQVTSSYGLDPWKMLEAVLLDDEYEAYMDELSKEGRFLFKIFFDQSVIKMPSGASTDAVILFALSFLQSCYSLCKKGLKKTLIYHEENLTAKLRGKININSNIKYNTTQGRCDKFFCKYIDFTEDIIENRIIKAALLRAQSILRVKLPGEGKIKQKIGYCLNILRHVKQVAITNRDFSAVAVSGLYAYYKPILQQARALLGSNIHSQAKEIHEETIGNSYSLPYVINMETLFEYYSRTELKKVFNGSEYRIEKYATRYYLQKGISSSQDAEKGIHLMPFCIPDITVYKDEKPILVLDAKYKPSGRSDRSDSHQLLAYVLLLGVEKCAFILPGSRTDLREMSSSQQRYLPLSPGNLRYYEMTLGNQGSTEELKRIML